MMHHSEFHHGHSPEEIAERLKGGPDVSYLRDWVYGGMDGAITTFAIVAGVVGASLSSSIIVILGLAKLIADAISMAAANYSGTKVERDDYLRLRRMEERQVKLDPEGETEEIRQIFLSKGFAGKDLEKIVRIVTSIEEHWVEVMMAEEYGMPPVTRLPLKSATATFLGFLACGSVPVLPFLVGAPHPAMVALVLTGAVFFAIGAIKSKWSTQHWAASGLETFLIGIVAAGIAYVLGDVLQMLF